MTENDADREVAQLQAENERLRALLEPRGIDSADIRADRAEGQRADLTSIHAALVENSEFNRQILENSTDCIKVLGLDGRLEFMSAGGMRVMEIEDFSTVAMCPWVEFWSGDHHQIAKNAVAAALAGDVGTFEGPAPTGKGNMRYWEVTVTPIPGPDGRPEKLLSISRDITRRYEAEKHRRVLMEEMHHRIKNTLTTVLSITEQSFRGTATMDDAKRAIRERILAMGKAHDLLIQNEWVSAKIDDVVAGAVAAYLGDDTRIAITGEPITLTSRAALTIAMLLNELCTNAVKYGAWTTKSGLVAISWNVEGNEFHFRWAEQQGPRVEPPTRRSFGTRLIERALPESIDGAATLRYEPTGLIFELRAPLLSLTALTKKDL